jgi:hypothetical protein
MAKTPEATISILNIPNQKENTNIFNHRDSPSIAPLRQALAVTHCGDRIYQRSNSPGNSSQKVPYGWES